MIKTEVFNLLLIKLNGKSGHYLNVKGITNMLNYSGYGKKYLIISVVICKKSPAMYAGDLCLQIKVYVQYGR
ncbi:Uncharacterised protein [Citrobacter koseri]|uniref:Uncharacterized protein n=2 Tax=Citrobacter koseri TaxID=545 RepID=A0A3S4M9L0_CITKO|nr:Uncharacterised protein [Citrobacter koseri]